ncbi:MAG: Gfo/Idh/MocA family oxidoreductase [Candidatus Dadabacteria bacterium]|nr:Gfo/Idh/MocA family oxidoreductase [Candidatus Dadabacteria bacterium]
MNIAIVGYGYWGPNLARNFASLEGASVRAVCETDPALAKKAQADHPLSAVTASFDDILADSSIDAVCVATPASSHADLSMRALAAGKHLLVEKPMAMSSSDGDRMAELADKKGLVLMVDHTFVYSGAVRKLAALAGGGELGDLYYFDSVRINLGIVQTDVNVLWDLAVHDLSILFQVSGEQPVAVSASAVSHISGMPVDTAYMTLHYKSSFIAHIHVGWLAPVKIRRTTVAGNRKMAIYDDTESTEKLKIYDSGVDMRSAGTDIKQLRVEYRSGDIHVPRIESSEPLSLVASEFLSSVREGRKPRTDAAAGSRIVRILEAADLSIRQNGERVAL